VWVNRWIGCGADVSWRELVTRKWIKQVTKTAASNELTRRRADVCTQKSWFVHKRFDPFFKAMLMLRVRRGGRRRVFSCACNNCTPCNEDVESIREEYVSPAEGGKETGGLRVLVSKPSRTRTRAARRRRCFRSRPTTVAFRSSSLIPLKRRRSYIGGRPATVRPSVLVVLNKFVK